MADAAQKDDLIRRAYVNLTSLRENMPDGYVHEKSFYKSFNQALDQLHHAGYDVNEWRLASNAVGETDGSEFKQKIEAILKYFTIQQERTAIGFNR